MTSAIFLLLFFMTIVFYMLDTAFKSFSKIALAGFLDDLEDEKIKEFDFLEKYDLLSGSFTAFSYFLQMCLFVGVLILFQIDPVVQADSVMKLGLVLVIFLVFFNVILSFITSFHRESILKKLIYLYYFPWLFFTPARIIYSFFNRNRKIEKDNDPDNLSEKELETFFEESTKDGVLEKEDKEMIESVIEFRDTLVKEIMTPRVDLNYIDRDVDLMELIDTINQSKKSRYPIISGRIDNIEGILLTKDLFDFWNKKDFDIRKLTRKPFFVPETMRIFKLLQELQISRQKFAIVVDEFGGISGVVTMEDILEEIVGEIQDEYDDDIENIVKEKDFFMVKGDTDISEISDELNIQIDEDEDYQTVGGLISFKLGKIPKKNDRIEIDDHIFEVIEMEKNRIKKVKIQDKKRNQ